MRNIIWILVAIVIVAGAYWLFTGQSPRDLAIQSDEPEIAQDAEPVVDEPAEAPAEDTATDTAPSADDATADEEPATDVTEDAAAEEAPATDGTEDATAEEDPATDATEDATAADEPATDATGDGAADQDAATEPSGDATDAETDAAESDAAETDAADTGTESAAAGDAQELLTMDGFDFERVNELIENSDLEPTQKTLLASGLEQAQDSPEMLEQILDQIREALDL